MYGRMLTKARLHRFGVQIDDNKCTSFDADAEKTEPFIFFLLLLWYIDYLSSEQLA